MKKVLILVIALIFAIGTGTTAVADLSDGLVGYYKMDADTVDGTTMYDSSKAGNDGTFNGAQVLATGVIGDAYDFTGAWIGLGNITAWEETNQLSFSIWAYWHGDPNPTGDNWIGLAGKRTGWSDTENQTYWYFEIGSDNRVGLASGPDGWAGTTHATPANEWIHYCATFDGTTAILYANGVEVGNYAWQFGPDLDAPVGIGCVDGNGNNDYNGLLDEVAFWNRALTPEEVAEIYNDGNGKELGGYPWKAINPYPEDGAEGVSADGVTLSWDAPDPEIQTPGPIREYDVYISSNPDPIVEPNALDGFVGTVPASGALEFVITSDMLAKDMTYYWRVDTVVDRDDSKGDPNIAIGDPWSFETEKTTPIILAHPQLAVVDLGGTATFTVGIGSPSEYTVKWYKVGVVASVGSGDTLEIPNVSPAETGKYYAIAENPAGFSPASKSASLVIRNQLVAHYACDDDLSAGAGSAVLDSSPYGHHGVSFGNTASVGGKVGGGAITFDGNTDGSGGDWVDCGRFNPSEGTGQLTVAYWTKWGGSTGTWQASVSKRDNWGAQNMLWQITAHEDNAGRVQIETDGSWPWLGQNVLTVDEWTHVTITFDGTDARLYFNGTLLGGPAGFSFSAMTDSTLNLGGAGNGNDPYYGALDDVRIYNYALTGEEVAQLVIDQEGGAVCLEYNQYDYDKSCVVDLADLMIFIQDGWLNCNIVPDCIP